MTDYLYFCHNQKMSGGWNYSTYITLQEKNSGYIGQAVYFSKRAFCRSGKELTGGNKAGRNEHL